MTNHLPVVITTPGTVHDTIIANTYSVRTGNITDGTIVVDTDSGTSGTAVNGNIVKTDGTNVVGVRWLTEDMIPAAMEGSDIYMQTVLLGSIDYANYEWQYVVSNRFTPTWDVLKPYNSSNIYIWNTGASSNGVRTLQARQRSITSTTEAEARDFTSVWLAPDV
jgi:hypothetical protein